MADASSGGGSSGAAGAEGGANFDSYIGSVISLTSKSDIRYEGVLYTIDAENCNIALQNVRSYGTEGRKKEGPQIPPKDSVYDYIIFRGSDIKDLQVKASPPAHAQPYNDPAIIAQSQQQQPGQQKPARVSSSVMTPPVGIPQPSSQLPTGFSHPPVMPHPGMPPPRDTGLLPPGYMTSSYPPPGLAAWGPRPPPPVGNGPMPHMYWPGYYPPPGVQPPFMHPPPQHVPPERPLLKPEMVSQAPLVTSGDFSQAPAEQPRAAESGGMTAVLTPIATRLPRLPVSHSPPLAEVKKEEAAPAERKEGFQVVPDSLVASSSNDQVKVPVRQEYVRHENVRERPDNGRYNWRGGRRGGRGRAPFHRAQNFTEDFDFTAMNEKFNKDEVWGELGKAGSAEAEDEEVGDKSWPKAEADSGKKSVYVKDEFFDSLSCDTLDREGGHNERPRFSEQRKINTETFGDAFLRSRGGRGNYRGYHMGGRGGGYRRGGRPHQAAAV